MVCAIDQFGALSINQVSSIHCLEIIFKALQAIIRSKKCG